MIQFSNPRLSASFADWPLGGSKKGVAIFKVVVGRDGERVERVTTGKPKYSTYGTRCCIVDGSNGRTYLLIETTQYNHAIRIVMSDLVHDAHHELRMNSAYVYAKPITSDVNEAQAESALFNTLLALLNEAHGVKA